MTKKYVSSILIIIAISFAWGYKGDSLVEYFKNSSLASNIENNESPNAIEANKVSNTNNSAPASQNTATQNNLGKTLESITPGQVPFERVDRANKLLVDSNKRIEDFQGGVQNIPAAQATQNTPPAIDVSNSNQQDVYRSLSAGINPGFQQTTPSEPDESDDDLEEEPEDASDDEDTTELDNESDTDTSDTTSEQTDLP
ncbi:MAG: hypothetical protein KBC84_01985 [Proteobacteria bacterium]|nr:hypothetical protein [Pseudomonadota bacterium]